MAAYSVLTYNIGGYEVLHEVRCPSPNAEYIYVTDNRSLTSSTWTMVYVDPPKGDPMGLCYYIRFNPFEFVNTDVVLRIDGSMGIVGDTDWLINKFNEGGYDIMLTPHPTRETAAEEQLAWVKLRGVKREQGNKVLAKLSSLGWDVNNDKGLYQYNVMIQRNNEVNNLINKETLNLIYELKPEDKTAERCDQIIGSVIINLHNLKPMMLKQTDLLNKTLVWYSHGTSRVMGIVHNIRTPFYKRQPYPWAL